MAQEIVTWCDVCMRDGDRVPGSTLKVEVGDVGPSQVDLCSLHFEEYVTPLVSLIEDGRPLETEQKEKGKGKGAARYACPECGPEVTMTRSSFRDHMPKFHGMTLAEFEARIGETLDGKALTYECDFPGCGLKFSHPQGMGAHKRHVHNVVGTSRRGEVEETLLS